MKPLDNQTKLAIVLTCIWLGITTVIVPLSNKTSWWLLTGWISGSFVSVQIDRFGR